MPDPFVIVGCGQAAAQAVASLRQEGYDGPLTLIGEEPFLPYQRPPLSKKFLAGELERDRLLIRPEAFYEGVDLRNGVRAEAIDRAAGQVRLSGGGAVAYEKLLLATGSRVRLLPVPGTELRGVHYLRGIADVEAIRAGLAGAKRLVVVGGGYIGLETAAVCRNLGLDVTVLEMESRVMARVTAPVMSEFFEAVHAGEGVNIRTGVRVAAIEGAGRVERVVSADGEAFPADLVIIGAGIVPNQELAAEAGLPCEDGIVVDEYARTPDPAIFAAGDCTRHPCLVADRIVRLESVQNAIGQSKVAAASMCGRLSPYEETPWFWSDQYDLKLQIAGLSQGHNSCTLRGAPESRSFAAFYLKDGRVIAVDAVNSPAEYLVGRKLVSARAEVAPERLADTAIPIKEIGAPYM
jgi:3-phenylpropionate/trans-cinnamate dioxygenase ferredoxin reductase component